MSPAGFWAFLSTLSLRRATELEVLYTDGPTIFLSTLSLRRATQWRTLARGIYGFLSTLSLRRATETVNRNRELQGFLSTLSLRRATKYITGAKLHDPDFYPRSPCGERHNSIELAPAGIATFLSTLSLRRATHYGWSWYDDFTISIHALLAESDIAYPIPRRGCAISIHALLAESDALGVHDGWCYRHFYPRSPCGERPLTLYLIIEPMDFYPRSPCGERLQAGCALML